MANANPNTRVTAALVAIIGAAAASMCIQLTGGSEGVSLTPYEDRIATRVDTVCYGETNIPMRRYTLAECQQILSDSLAGYAKGVRRTVPGFDALTPGQKVAAIDYSYNRGLGAWGRQSLPGEPPSVKEAYAAHDFPHACDLFVAWAIVKRNGRWVDCSRRENQCYGIYTRRVKERAACLGV